MSECAVARVPSGCVEMGGMRDGARSLGARVRQDFGRYMTEAAESAALVGTATGCGAGWRAAQGAVGPGRDAVVVRAMKASAMRWTSGKLVS
ncbi:hypothetical protein EDD29_4876 [Actinocorallia herbida]|uniref:Uncharacterized protein n=1 Tax=Actinocorallia herbida TaxID=58109 RepID=A0A3N1D197_9ACTN|nr:hypothetical protein EDD29_4876 [Actinocorallia herbida]